MTHSQRRRDWYLHIGLLERGKESIMALCILFCSINKDFNSLCYLKSRRMSTLSIQTIYTNLSVTVPYACPDFLHHSYSIFSSEYYHCVVKQGLTIYVYLKRI